MLLEEQIRSSAGDGPHLRALAKPILTGIVLLECSVPAVNRGRCPLSDLAQQFTADRGRQLRHLPAKLVSRAQQGHFWRALHRWRTGRAWILAQGEVCRVISTSKYRISRRRYLAVPEVFEARNASRLRMLIPESSNEIIS